MELVVWSPSHRREHRRHKEVETHRTIPAERSQLAGGGAGHGWASGPGC